MESVDSLVKKCNEFEKMAAAKAKGPSEEMIARQEQMVENQEHAKKFQGVRLALMEIKKICDIIEVKYRSLEKPSGLFKFLDTTNFFTMRNLKKVKNVLENTSKGLDR